jgi:hypothetical protein
LFYLVYSTFIQYLALFVDHSGVSAQRCVTHFSVVPKVNRSQNIPNNFKPKSIVFFSLCSCLRCNCKGYLHALVRARSSTTGVKSSFAESRESVRHDFHTGVYILNWFSRHGVYILNWFSRHQVKIPSYVFDSGERLSRDFDRSSVSSINLRLPHRLAKPLLLLILELDLGLFGRKSCFTPFSLAISSIASFVGNIGLQTFQHLARHLYKRNTSVFAHVYDATAEASVARLCGRSNPRMARALLHALRRSSNLDYLYPPSTYAAYHIMAPHTRSSSSRQDTALDLP